MPRPVTAPPSVIVLSCGTTSGIRPCTQGGVGQVLVGCHAADDRRPGGRVDATPRARTRTRQARPARRRRGTGTGWTCASPAGPSCRAGSPRTRAAAGPPPHGGRRRARRGAGPRSLVPVTSVTFPPRCRPHPGLAARMHAGGHHGQALPRAGRTAHEVYRPPAGLLRGHGAVPHRGRRGRPRQRLAQGLPGHVRGAGPHHRRLPRPDRQRRRDDRAPAPERPDNDHVLLVHRRRRRSCAFTAAGAWCCRATPCWPALAARVCQARRRKAPTGATGGRSSSWRSTGSPTRAATPCPVMELAEERDLLARWRSRSPSTSSPNTGRRRTRSASTACPPSADDPARPRLWSQHSSCLPGFNAVILSELTIP